MKLSSVLCCLLLAAAGLSGCGQKQDKEPRTGAMGHPEELADTTRFDSAIANDSTTIEVSDTASARSTGY